MTSGRSLGYQYAVLGTFLTATSFITVKYALRAFNVETFTLIWAGGAAVFMFLIIAAGGDISALRIPKEYVGKLILLGISSAIGMILGWAGIALLDPSYAALLFRFYPIFGITVGIFFLREHLETKELPAILLMISGGLFSVAGRWGDVGTGFLLILLACISTAVQMVLAKLITSRVSPMAITFYRTFMAFFAVLAWGAVGNGFTFRADYSYWIITLAGALLTPCLGLLAIYKSLQYIELSRYTIVNTTQPLFVLPLAYIFLGDLPTGKGILGGTAILAGSLWLVWIHNSGKRYGGAS